MRFFYILLKFHIFRGYIVYLGVFGLNIFYLISLRDSISSLEWSTMVDRGRQRSTNYFRGYDKNLYQIIFKFFISIYHLYQFYL